MNNKDFTKFLLGLYENPSFRKGFSDFFVNMQQDGIEKAKEFWNIYPEKDKFSFEAPEVFEQMIEFYSEMGFVSRKKYDAVLSENQKIKKENDFLKRTIKEVNLKAFTEEGKKIQDSWKDIVEKQMETSKEMSESFFKIFKQDDKK